MRSRSAVPDASLSDPLANRGSMLRGLFILNRLFQTPILIAQVPILDYTPYTPSKTPSGPLTTPLEYLTEVQMLHQHLQARMLQP